MPDVEERIYNRLSTSTGTTDLVSNRVYPDELPQRVTLPAMTYSRVGTDREVAMGSNPGNVHGRYRITYYADSPKSARDGAQAVRQVLQRWSVATGASEIEDTFLVGEYQVTDPERKSAMYIQDWLVHYIEYVWFYPEITGDTITGFTLDSTYAFTATGSTINGTAATGTWGFAERANPQNMTSWEEV